MVAVVALYYAGEDVSLRFRIPRWREPFGTVHVERYYAISEKNNRVQYLPAEPEDVTCVHGLLPHFGLSPCWYAGRTTRKAVEF